MSAPITVEGPFVNRRRQRVRALSLTVLCGLLLATPFIAAALAAGMGN